MKISSFLSRTEITPEHLLKIAVFLLFCLFALNYLSIPLFDIDFWWHIATGRYIVENKTLPDHDPFSYTTGLLTDDRKIVLNGNWLSEVVFYFLYSLWGEKGVIMLRVFLMILFVFFIYRNMRQQGAEKLPAIMILYVVFSVVRFFSGERPQLFTFTAFAFSHYALENYKLNRSLQVFLLPVVVLFLANMHPGYIICLLLIGTYTVGEIIESLIRKKIDKPYLLKLFAVFVMSVIFSMLNPNGPMMLKLAFSFHGELTRDIIEFMSPFELHKKGIIPIYWEYLAFLFMSILCLLFARTLGLTRILLLGGFTAMSLIAARYQIFFIAVTASLLANTMPGMQNIINSLIRRVQIHPEKDPGQVPGNENIKAGAIRFIIPALACLIFASFVTVEFNTLRKNWGQVLTRFSTPAGAADFLSREKIRGNMFNDYEMGGYLIWRLFPGKKVFIDTRKLDQTVFDEYDAVMSLYKSRTGSWKEILQKHDISHVIISPLMPNGATYPFVEKLFISNDWILVYADHFCLVFVKNSDLNMPVIKRRSIQKEAGLNTIVVQASSKAMIFPKNTRLFVSIGKAFYMSGRFDDAAKAFSHALDKNPGDKDAKFWLDRLNNAQGKSR